MQFDLSQALASLQAMAASFVAFLPYLVVALIVYAAFHFAGRYANRAIIYLTERRRRHRNLGRVLGRLAQGGLMLVGLLVALVIAVPSFQPAQLVQLLGISGVAIGFAFRDILQNFLAGILILLTEPFRIGDQISVTGFDGTVEEIETRATFIRTFDGRRVVIPNSTLFSQSVTVDTAYEKRRLQYDVGIGYGDDIARARRVMLGAMGGIDGVLSEPAPEVLLVDLAGSSVNLRAHWWIASARRADLMGSQDRVLQALKEALQGAGVDLPYPTTQVLFHDQTETTDGDRARQREGWPAGDGAGPGARDLVAAIRARRHDEAEGRPDAGATASG
ncbi:mechanosensitive ion channel family protein [Lichenibacterium dinghuense]|uniref:mechanosensitive ion channel family protein n=1 Tax=Lichenibacterium dinghuense TaxID=2895977 RepID=UPI001F1DE148|nr:mechanosensitive ion channel family protein [Lichenibacterium sp. 6Y81]